MNIGAVFIACDWIETERMQPPLLAKVLGFVTGFPFSGSVEVAHFMGGEMAWRIQEFTFPLRAISFWLPLPPHPSNCMEDAREGVGGDINSGSDWSAYV